jgi:cytochrome c
LGELKGAVYHSETPEKPGYVIAVTEAPTGGETETAKVPLGELLAKADPAKGQEAIKPCQACHDFTKGGPNKIGPNLWDVVDRPVASHAGFEYSPSLKDLAKDKWTFELLNQFVDNPKSLAPKTKMVFSGIKRDTQRADVLAYLRTLSDSPKPFPAP